MSHSKKRTKTTLVHRHVKIDNRPTSLALEPEFWQYLREVAYSRRVTLGRLFSVINQHKGKDIPLASALRALASTGHQAWPQCLLRVNSVVSWMRGSSAVRSISDIGARVCPTAAAVNAAMIEAATTNSGTKRNCSAS